MQCADRKRNGDALTFQFVPNIGPDGVVDLVDRGVIAHVKLDLVDDRMIGEIDEENSRRRILKTSSAFFVARISASFTRLGGICNQRRHEFAWRGLAVG